MNLNAGHLLLGGRYRVERVLGTGGFGITYLCEQVNLSRKVAIKEFFMREYCERLPGSTTITLGSSGSREMVDRFRQKFIKEARALAALNHKHIVRIIDIFEENNTAYYVMEHVGGGSLSDKVKAGAIPEADAVRYIRQVASALDFVHSKRMMHLDVKPANILLDNDEAVLIDFGLAKQYDATGAQTSTTPVGISHGYAPMEQYKRGGVGTFSPATDIYSLGATLYKLLTGSTPPEASDVMNFGLPDLPADISPSVRAAVETAMQPAMKIRPQNVGEFLLLLDGRDEKGEMRNEKGESESSLGEAKSASERVGENLFTHTTSASRLGETKAETTISSTAGGPPPLDQEEEFRAKNNAADDGETVVGDAVIFRGKPSTTRSNEREKSQSSDAVILSASEESQSSSSVISSGSDKSHKHAKKEILHSVQNDNGGKQKGESSGGTSKKRWAIIIAILVIGAVAALFGTMSGGGSDDTAAERERLATRTFTVNGVSFKMVAVEGGTFTMDATSEQQNPDSDEEPVHNVTLSDYSIGETEVTQALWQAVMGTSIYDQAKKGTYDTDLYGVGDNNPMYYISYEDCITFINKLNSQLSGQLPAGRKFRLPTEAEWEYAARGGNRSRGYQYSGSNSLGSVAWYGDNSNSKTHPVKQKQANELGLYDMSGNVYEWCYDWYGSYSSSSQTNPKGPSSGSYRVLRGGGWFYFAQNCRVANRNYGTPDARGYGNGLRLAL